MGRNSIPLPDVEQIAKDTPGLIASKENPKLEMVCRTLGRGLVNTFGGFLEIPYRVRKQIRDTDPATGLVFGGVEGVAFGVVRTTTVSSRMAQGRGLGAFPVPDPGEAGPPCPDLSREHHDDGLGRAGSRAYRAPLQLGRAGDQEREFRVGEDASRPLSRARREICRRGTHRFRQTGLAHRASPVFFHEANLPRVLLAVWRDRS